MFNVMAQVFLDQLLDGNTIAPGGHSMAFDFSILRGSGSNPLQALRLFSIGANGDSLDPVDMANAIGCPPDWLTCDHLTCTRDELYPLLGKAALVTLATMRNMALRAYNMPDREEALAALETVQESLAINRRLRGC